MKILIVSAFYYPEITPRSFRTTELTEELVKRGHDVTLSIPYRDFDYKQYYNQNSGPKIIFFNKRKNEKEYQRGLKRKLYYLVKIIGGYLFSYPDIKFRKDIFKTFKNCDSQYDLLISIGAPHSIHWGCSMLFAKNKKFLAKKWIADCGDPFMGNQVTKHPFYFKWLEKTFCNRADYITIPIEEARNAYYEEFQNKIKIIPQGFDFSPYANIEKVYQADDNLLRFAYAGMFYGAYRNLDSFVLYLKDVKVNYKLYLFTPDCSLVQKYKKILGEKLIVVSPLQREKLIKELATMDFLINIANNGNVQKPSKLIDYALAKRPILTISQKLDRNIIDEFFHRNYIHQTLISDIEQYNIINVVDNFLRL